MNTIQKFTLKQTYKGTLIASWLVFAMLAAQGVGIHQAMPNPIDRAKVISAFIGNPILSFIYGVNDKAITPAGYMLYRSGPLVILLLGIWLAMRTVKLLRGQEESGRLEILAAGKSSVSRAVVSVSTVLLFSVVAMGFVWLLALLALSRLSYMELEPKAAVLVAISLTATSLLSVALGIVASQLYGTKQKANRFVVQLLVGWFVIRGVAEIDTSFRWLKWLSPTGWFDKIMPFSEQRIAWIAAIAGVAFVGVMASLFYARKRDLGESVIAQQDTKKPSYRNLSSIFRFVFRQNKGIAASWILAAVGMAGVVAGIANTAATAVKNSPALSKEVSNITGAKNGTVLASAFIGLGFMFVAVFLMVLTANIFGSMRSDESSLKSDNLLVRRVTRLNWVLARIVFCIVSYLLTIVLAGIVIKIVASQQNISLDFWPFFRDSFNTIAAPLLLLGIAVLGYGFWPRKNQAVLYTIFGWAFLAQIAAELITNEGLKKLVNKSSLLYYIHFPPGSKPDWLAFALISIIVMVVSAAGIIAFRKRDTLTE